MSRRVKVEDSSYKMSRVDASLTAESYEDRRGKMLSHAGSVATPQGYVRVVSVWYEGKEFTDGTTHLSIIVGGRRYWRTYRRGFASERGLSIAAGRFARDTVVSRDRGHHA